MINKVTDQEIGARNAESVKRYVEAVDLKKVPLNQFEKASRRKIAVEILELPKSVLDRSDVKAFFNQLDERIGANPGQCFSPSKGSSVDVKVLEKKIRTLENHLVALKAENEEMKREVLGEEWFLSTGRMVRL